MRLILDTLVALMLVAVLGGVTWQQRSERLRVERIEGVRQAITAIESQSLYRAALGEVEATAHGYAARIDPDWFHPRPRNLLIGSGPRWLDQAEGEQRKRFHPACIVAGRERAAFWYNPGRGLVRARVPMQLSHHATVELYNQVNAASLDVQDVQWPAPPPPSLSAKGPGEAQKAAEPGPIDPVLRDFGADG